MFSVHLRAQEMTKKKLTHTFLFLNILKEFSTTRV